MIMSLKQRKKKFEPRIKLNHNIYTKLYKLKQCDQNIFPGKLAIKGKKILRFDKFIGILLRLNGCQFFFNSSILADSF